MAKVAHEKRKPPTISDVIHEVEKLDILEKGTKEYEKAHKATVSVVTLANSFHGAGWTSISKTRSLLQYMRYNKRGTFLDKKEQKEDSK